MWLWTGIVFLAPRWNVPPPHSNCSTAFFQQGKDKVSWWPMLLSVLYTMMPENKAIVLWPQNVQLCQLPSKNCHTLRALHGQVAVPHSQIPALPHSHDFSYCHSAFFVDSVSLSILFWMQKTISFVIVLYCTEQFFFRWQFLFYGLWIMWPVDWKWSPAPLLPYLV